MDPTDLPLFALADRRLAWLDRRVATVAQNIANADTPRFRPRDVAPFAATLRDLGGTLGLARTDMRHQAGGGGAGGETIEAADGERSPDGNGVSLDIEMLRMSQTDLAHDLVREVYKKYLGMFRVAAGR